MRVLLIGANGQLGQDLQRALEAHTVLAATRATLDVSQPAQAREVIASFQPDLVLNTSAFHRVDDIEKDAAQALAINAQAAHQLALACRDADCALMHISTDYVFDGAKRAPYVEDDCARPLSAYGASKLAGEALVRSAWRKHYIVRTCGLYGAAGASGKGGNFVNTMLRLAREGVAAGAPRMIRVVNDQTCTPTSTRDLAAQLAVLIETGAFGTYHATNDGACTWFEFASEIFRRAGIEADARPTTSAEYGAAAARPAYSVLENRGMRSLGIDRMRHWTLALQDYLEAIGAARPPA